jgi:predicted CXXCH cytochrome family protein
VVESAERGRGPGPRSLRLAGGLTLLLAAAAAAAAGRLAPVPADEALSTHGPFEMGDCRACHVRRRGPDPGKVRRASPGLCFDCHEDFRAPVKGHPAASETCTACHSPHNSRKRKLLL